MTTTTTPPRRTRAATAALSLAIGMLVAAALLGGFFIIVGDQANVAARAWMTLFLVAAFAGVVLLDASVGDGPNRWYLAASTVTNVVLVAVGLLKIWNGWGQPADTADAGVWAEQIGRFVLVVLLLRVALLVTQLYGLYFVARAKSTASAVAGVVTLVLVWVTALILAIPAAFPALDWPDWWWRTAGATSLVALVSAIIPILVKAFEPKPPRPAPAPVQAPAAPFAHPTGAPVPPAAQPAPPVTPPTAPPAAPP
ncbi:hypothetical protein GE115_15430, partial [Agromyces sp. CFH 90414]